MEKRDASLPSGAEHSEVNLMESTALRANSMNRRRKRSLRWDAVEFFKAKTNLYFERRRYLERKRDNILGLLGHWQIIWGHRGTRSADFLAASYWYISLGIIASLSLCLSRLSLSSESWKMYTIFLAIVREWFVAPVSSRFLIDVPEVAVRQQNPIALRSNSKMEKGEIGSKVDNWKNQRTIQLWVILVVLWGICDSVN